MLRFNYYYNTNNKKNKIYKKKLKSCKIIMRPLNYQNLILKQFFLSLKINNNKFYIKIMSYQKLFKQNKFN